MKYVTVLSTSLWYLERLDEDTMFFFFQAEDGIRDLTVTGVQTCALPIGEAARSGAAGGADRGVGGRVAAGGVVAGRAHRSGAVRRRVLRHRADGGRVPAGRGAGPAARTGSAAAAADLGAGAGQRRAR